MFPSIETLSVGTDKHRETVRRALEKAARTGWVERALRGRQPALGRGWKRYTYIATIPDGWVHLDDIDYPWERDPTWTSERARTGAPRKAKPSRDVPVCDRDVKVGNGVGVPVPVDHVPALGRARPCPSRTTSQCHANDVPVPDSMTSSSTHSETSSHEGALSSTQISDSDLKAKIVKLRSIRFTEGEIVKALAQFNVSIERVRRVEATLPDPEKRELAV